MNAPFSPPVDLLTQAIERVRPMLATGTSKQRVRVLWAATKAARDLGASDVVADAFMELAVEINLIDKRGHWTGADVRDYVRRHGTEDVRHVISWALRGWNPFERGQLEMTFDPDEYIRKVQENLDHVSDRRQDGDGGEKHKAPPFMPILKLGDWLKRDLAPPDLVLGELLSTTSRVIISAPTGIGKTLFGMGMFMGTSAGRGFLRWRSVRPARTLFIDGEMSRRLLKQRLADKAKRLGVVAENMHVLSREDVENFSTAQHTRGQMFIKRVIEHLGGIDLIGLDNVMSLIGGDMKDEEGWRQILPLVHWFTRQSIGQVWIHHTGYDLTHGYGTSTREWQLDAVALLKEAKRPDTDVSFLLKFSKARERTPANRADFANLKVALVNNQWTWQAADGVGKNSVPPVAMKFFDALVNATIGNGTAKMHGCPTATIEEWRGECFKTGLLDKDKPKPASASFSKYRLALIAANWIACNETVAWTLSN